MVFGSEIYWTCTPSCGMGRGRPETSSPRPAMPSAADGVVAESSSYLAAQGVIDLQWAKSLTAWQHQECPLFWFSGSQLFIFDSFTLRGSHCTEVPATPGVLWERVSSRPPWAAATLPSSSREPLSRTGSSGSRDPQTQRSLYCHTLQQEVFSSPESH